MKNINTIPTTHEEIIDCLNKLQTHSGFVYKWNHHWRVSNIKLPGWRGHDDYSDKSLAIEVTRNKCHIWSYDVNRNLHGVQVMHNHWLWYNPAINGFDNGVLNTVQPTSEHHTFIYIQVR